MSTELTIIPEGEYEVSVEYIDARRVTKDGTPYLLARTRIADEGEFKGRNVFYPYSIYWPVPIPEGLPRSLEEAYSWKVRHGIILLKHKVIDDGRTLYSTRRLVLI